MDEAADVPTWRADPPTVAAVLVAHDGAAWLPKVLGSLSTLSHAPTAWHAVDVSSTDGSSDLLRRSFGGERITYAPSGTGFGDAVRLALAELPPTDWIWLLHDDVTVTPGTLAGLLDEATSADDIGIVGPKIREWPSLRRLVEVGLTISGTASRETGLETGEPDAGQHDWAEDVLAVNTAGMLVRRDVWDELGGLDPDLPLFADDIDLGWRANLAGYRVRTAPGAVVFHAEASRRLLRTPTAGDPPHWEKRRAGLHVVLANASRRRYAWQLVRLFFGSLLRALGQLLARDPEGAADELLAMRDVYLHLGRVRRARQRRQAQRRRPHEEIAHLFPPWWLPYQHAWDGLLDMGRAMVRPETVETIGHRTHPVETEDDLDLDDRPSVWRRRPWLVVVLLLLLAAVAAGRGLAPGLSGGALPPAPETAGGWWGLVVSGAGDVGLPTTAFAPTYALLLALAAIPVWFAPELLVWALMILAVPLAALAAHRLGRLISTHRPARITWAVSYGLVVAATGAASQGRIGVVVGLVVAPIILNVALQLVTVPHWQTALRLGIWTAVGAAFAPVLFWMVLVGLIAVVVALRSDERFGDIVRNLGVALGVAAVLSGPWLLTRVLPPWRTWWEAGLPVPAEASLLDAVLGLGGGPGSVPWWFSVPAVLLAVLALVPRLTRAEVRWAWVVAMIGLVTTLAAHVVVYSTPSGAAGIEPSVAVPAGIWIAALLAAGLLAAEELEFLPRVVTAVVVAAALVFPVGSAAWWLVRGTADPLTDGTAGVVPAYLAERDGATLVITGDVEDGVTYRIDVGPGVTLGEEAMLRSTDTSREVEDAIDQLLSSPSTGAVETLVDVGIGAIYLPDASDDLATRIDAAPSMSPAGSESPDSRVWTITGESDSPSADSPWWRWLGGVAHVLVWLLALVLTAPVRRRPEPPPLDDDLVDPEPVAGTTTLGTTDSSGGVAR